MQKRLRHALRWDLAASGLHLQRKSLELLCNGLVIPYRQGGSHTYQLRLVEVPAGQIIRSASEFTLLASASSIIRVVSSIRTTFTTWIYYEY